MYEQFKIEFTDKVITPWSGTLMMIKMLEKIRFDACLSQLELPAQGSNRGYGPSQLIKQFMTGVGPTALTCKVFMPPKPH